MQYYVVSCKTGSNMHYHAIPSNTIPYHGILCNNMQYHAIPCSTIPYHAIQCNTMQYHIAPWHIVQYPAIQCITMQYHAIPCNTMQYLAIPCNTMHYHACWNTADGAYHCPVGSIWPFLAPSGALIAIPTYYWPTHPTPLFQITPVLNTGLSLSEPLQLYKGYNAI